MADSPDMLSGATSIASIAKISMRRVAIIGNR